MYLTKNNKKRLGTTRPKREVVSVGNQNLDARGTDLKNEKKDEEIFSLPKKVSLIFINNGHRKLPSVLPPYETLKIFRNNETNENENKANVWKFNMSHSKKKSFK